MINMLFGILVPFLGTSAGAACVFLVKNTIRPGVQKALLGFASGVMVAASVWSLLIPAMDMCEDMGKLAFLPAACGFLLGMLFLLVLDHLIPHLHINEEKPEGLHASFARATMLVLAVTLHNIPEGMAVGVVFAGAMAGGLDITLAGAFALSIGIAIQNFPEGAIISLPLKSEGAGKGKAFLYGVLITVALSAYITAVLPVLLAFAAGAMLYVVVEELIPEASESPHSNIGTIGFAAGFVIMMILDVALG